MKEKPIIFSTHMVKAILDGRKTQTRRIIKPQPHDVDEIERITNTSGVNYYLKTKSHGMLCDGIHMGGYLVKAKYQASDILWVRESFVLTSLGRAIYKAGYCDKDGNFWPSVANEPYAVNWKPSIHMPRASARIFLEVKAVRVERVQDIIRDDCLAEGITNDVCRYNGHGEYCNCIDRYSQLWNKTNAKRGYGWESNPFVWVYEFERVER